MKRFLCVVLALAITLSCAPCLAAERGCSIVLTTQDGTRIAGTADTAVTIRRGAYDADVSLFSWSAYRHNEFGYLSLNLSDDQVDWAKRQEGPATLEVDGQVFSGTVTCWLPTWWVLSFHPDGGDDSPAGQTIHAALYGQPRPAFADVPADAWYAPYVDVCVEAGVMKGTSETTFSPEQELTLAEVMVLTARQAAKTEGGSVPQIDDRFFEMAVFADADGQRLGTLLDKQPAPGLSGLQNIWLFSLREEALAQAARRPITLTLDTTPLAEYPRSLLNAFGFSDPGAVQGTWTGVWDGDLGCYAVDFGDDIPRAPEFMLGLSSLTAICAVNRSQGLWYQSELVYLLVSDVSLDCLESVAPTDWLEHPREWLEGPATRGDFGALLGQLLPSPIITQLPPEDVLEIQDLGVRTLILSGVMEGTGAGYALEKGLTRAEAAAMVARVLKPELRKTQAPAVPARQPEELTGITVQHRSFGQVEVQYTLDLEKNSLEVLSPATFGREEERREVAPLDPAAVAAFRASPAVEGLLGWGPIYYNMNVLDGHQWSVTLTFADGTSRDIRGSNAYPEGWDLLYAAMLELTGKNIMSTTSDWLDWDE